MPTGTPRFHLGFSLTCKDAVEVLPVATDLITQFDPAIVKHDVAVRAREVIATEIAPALGWRPAA